jgi:hypothetical protein
MTISLGQPTPLDFESQGASLVVGNDLRLTAACSRSRSAHPLTPMLALTNIVMEHCIR